MQGVLIFAGSRASARVARCAACLLVGLVPCAPAAADCQILQIAELPVETTDNRVVIHGEINGQKVAALVDTGSAMSFLWRPAARKLGLHLVDDSRVHMYGIGGETLVQATVVRELKLDKLTASNVRLAVAGDLAADFDMILGADILSRFTVEFDLAHGAVRLFQPRQCRPEQLAYWAKAYSFADLIASPADSTRVQTTVLLNGKPVRAILDSGTAVSTVSSAAAEMAGVPPDGGTTASGQRIGGIGRKSLQSWTGTFASFSIGDETIRNAQLRIAELNQNSQVERTGSRIQATREIVPTMLIGADFLRSHRLVVAGADRKLVFTYIGGPVFQGMHHAAAPGSAPTAGDSPPTDNEPAHPP